MPPEVELYLRDNIPEICGFAYIDYIKETCAKNSFTIGWIKGRIYACEKILAHVKNGKMQKSEAKELIEFILSQKLNSQ